MEDFLPMVRSTLQIRVQIHATERRRVDRRAALKRPGVKSLYAILRTARRLILGLLTTEASLGPLRTTG